MTSEEAKKTLEIVLDSAENRCARNIVIPDLIESIRMAIEALKEPKQGEWGEWDESNGYPCSVCGGISPIY